MGSSGRVVGLRYDPAWSQGNTKTNVVMYYTDLFVRVLATKFSDID